VKYWRTVRQMFWPPDNECTAAASGGVGSTATITVTDMQGSLFILGGGLLLAFCTMLLECLMGSKAGAGAVVGERKEQGSRKNGWTPTA
jgi:hypothetical protein